MTDEREGTVANKRYPDVKGPPSYQDNKYDLRNTQKKTH